MTESPPKEQTITREALYELVWSEPMLKIATQFNVSSSYMARVCTQLGVPRPPRGYWAKLTAGKVVRVPKLPAPRPGEACAWTRDGNSSHFTQPNPSAPTTLPTTIKIRPHQIHPLIEAARPHLENAAITGEMGYLKPAQKRLLDVVVTQPTINQALAFANLLFLSLEAAGYPVQLAAQGQNLSRAAVDPLNEERIGYIYPRLWSPSRCTVVYIGTVAIGLTIVEISEEVPTNPATPSKTPPYKAPLAQQVGATLHPWHPRTNEQATGRLRLQAFCPYAGFTWKQDWQEAQPGKLIQQVKTMVQRLGEAAIEIAQGVANHRGRMAAEHQRVLVQMAEARRQEAIRLAAKSRKDSQNNLLQIIHEWSQSLRIAEFFEAAESELAQLPPIERAAMQVRIASARRLMNWDSPLERLRQWHQPFEPACDSKKE